MKVTLRAKQSKGDFVTRYNQIVTKEYLDSLRLEGGQPVEYAYSHGRSPGVLKNGYYERHDGKHLVISTKAVITGNKTDSERGHMFHFGTYGHRQSINLESLRYFLAFARPDYRKYKMEEGIEPGMEEDLELLDRKRNVKALKKLMEALNQHRK